MIKRLLCLGCFLAVLCVCGGCKRTVIVDANCTDVNVVDAYPQGNFGGYLPGCMFQTITFDDGSVIRVIGKRDQLEPVGRGKRTRVFVNWLGNRYFEYPEAAK